MSAEEIYSLLSRGEPVDGLTRLPVDDVLRRLRERFPAFDPASEFPDVDLDDGNIEFGWSDYHFRFDRRGDVSAADRNALVEIMAVYGCPLYDPQVNRRYDAAGGTTIGETPKFEDATPEQRAEMESLKAKMMAEFAGPRQKRGCAGSAALLVGIAGMSWAIVRRLTGGA